MPSSSKRSSSKQKRVQRKKIAHPTVKITDFTNFLESSAELDGNI